MTTSEISAGPARPNNNEWRDWPSGHGSDLYPTQELTLSVTDQSDRNCGWCWHVRIGVHLDEFANGAGEPSAEAAKSKAVAVTRELCERMLAALPRVGEA